MPATVKEFKLTYLSGTSCVNVQKEDTNSTKHQEIIQSRFQAMSGFYSLYTYLVLKHV